MQEQNIPLTGSQGSPWVALGTSMMRFKRWLVGVPVLVAAVVGGGLQLMPDEYTAVLKIAPSPLVQMYMWGLREPGVTESVSKQLDLVKHYNESSPNRARLKLISNVQFVSNLQDNFVDVRVTDRDPAMASKIANAYGEGLIDLLTRLHLTPASNAIYGLQSRRERAIKNLEQADKRLGEAEVKSALPYISTSTRLGLVGMAGIQAETTLSNPGVNDLARQTLDQNELTRLQERLLSIQRALSDDKLPAQRAGLPVANLIAAADALQDQAYWDAMVSRIDRRIDVLRATERDEIRLIRATAPDITSGPPRGTLTAAAAIVAFLLTLAVVLIRAQFSKPVGVDRH